MRASQIWIAGVLLMTGFAYAQEPQKATTPWPPVDPNAANAPNATSPAPVSSASASSVPVSSAQGAQAAANKFTVPAGTKVLLAIKSAVNTKTAKAGDSVYFESTFPVVVDGHVLIPPGVYVQGVLDRVVRPGRVKGRAEVAMHFTSIIFPNGVAIEIPGTVSGLPGSASASVKDPEGTIQENSSKGKDAGNIAKATATGAGLGTIGGAAAGHPLGGAGYGAAGGLIAGGLYTLFTRGDEVAIPQGTAIEMILQRPMLVQEQTYAPALGPGNSNQLQPTMGPSSGQQQPMPKPAKQPLVCPPGELGCGQ